MDDRTIRFLFKEPFLDFAFLFGTANVAGAGWVVPEKYYKQVGADAFKQKPIGAGPYNLVRQEPGVKIEMEAFEGYYRPVNVKQLVMISVPEAATRVAMLERGEADIIYFVPGELINKVRASGRHVGARALRILVDGVPRLQDPKNPFRDKRVREADEPGHRPAGHQPGGGRGARASRRATGSTTTCSTRSSGPSSRATSSERSS